MFSFEGGQHVYSPNLVVYETRQPQFLDPSVATFFVRFHAQHEGQQRRGLTFKPKFQIENTAKLYPPICYVLTGANN